MKSELACLAGFDNAVLGGIGPERAVAAAESALGEGATGLVSFGVAGGLDETLKAGDVIIADAVVTTCGRRYETDAAWRGNFPGNIGGVIVGSDVGVASLDAKRELAGQTRAIAVDMESHAIAAVADHAGVPFLIIRAIADTRSRPLPSWLSKHMDRDGTVREGAIALETLFRFWEIPTMIGLATDSRRAHRALRDLASVVGPDFGFPV